MITSLATGTRGLSPARRASSLAHIIPSVSIHEKSGSKYLFTVTLSPLMKAATNAWSALTTSSWVLASGCLVCAATKFTDTAHSRDAIAKYRFIINLVRTGLQILHPEAANVDQVVLLPIPGIGVFRYSLDYI